jgi:hypothetical protein
MCSVRTIRLKYREINEYWPFISRTAGSEQRQLPFLTFRKSVKKSNYERKQFVRTHERKQF